MNKPILEVKNLVKTFVTKKFFEDPVSFTAVNDISFNLNEGEVLGLLGPNGAGKTTTLQMLLGLLTPTSGQIKYFGKDFAAHRTEILEKVSFASTYLKLPGILTVSENLNLYGKLYNMPEDFRTSQIDKNLRLFEIWELRNNLTKTLSAGQLTRLMLAKAFLPNPKIVFLDEPTAALDPDISLQVRKFILERKKELGISIIFTSHNMAEVEELCDKVLVLKNGQIIASETPRNLAKTVTTCRVQLLVNNIDLAVNFATARRVVYEVEEMFITFEVDEQDISKLLISITQADIKYTEISIEKPTLEDYFLQITKRDV